MPKIRFSRREILARAGSAAVLLSPVLRARGARGAPPPTRLVTFYHGDGFSISLDQVFPKRKASGWDWGQSPMKALQPHESYLSLARGVRLNNNSNPMISNHQAGALIWATGLTDLASVPHDPTGEYYLAQDMSFDHWYAQATATQKLYVAVGHAESNFFSLSLAGREQPSIAQEDPQMVYQNLFGSLMPNSDPTGKLRAAKQRLYVLDVVVKDLKAAEARFGLGSEEKQKLESYEATLAQIEKSIKADVANTGPAITPPTKPQAKLTSAVPLRARALMDITVGALSLDLRRSVAFQLSAPYDVTIDYSKFIPGAATAHHNAQHGIGGATGDPALASPWHYQQLAYLLSAMRAAKEPDGSNLLDNSVVYTGTDTSDGISHAFVDTDHTTLIFGKAGGRLKGNVEAPPPPGGFRDVPDLMATAAEVLAASIGVPNRYRQIKGFKSLISEFLV